MIADNANNKILQCKFHKEHIMQMHPPPPRPEAGEQGRDQPHSSASRDGDGPATQGAAISQDHRLQKPISSNDDTESAATMPLNLITEGPPSLH